MNFIPSDNKVTLGRFKTNFILSESSDFSPLVSFPFAQLGLGYGKTIGTGNEEAQFIPTLTGTTQRRPSLSSCQWSLIPSSYQVGKLRPRGRKEARVRYCHSFLKYLPCDNHYFTPRATWVVPVGTGRSCRPSHRKNKAMQSKAKQSKTKPNQTPTGSPFAKDQRQDTLGECTI